MVCCLLWLQVLEIWESPSSTDESTVLESKNPSQNQQTQLTTIYKVLLKVNFPNLDVFFVALTVYRIYDKYIESGNTGTF